MTTTDPDSTAGAVTALVQDVARRHADDPAAAAAAIAGLGLELIGVPEPAGSGGEPGDLAAALAAVGRAGLGVPVLPRAVAAWVLAGAGAPGGPATIAFGAGETVTAPWARDCTRLVLCPPSGPVSVVALDAAAVQAGVDLAGDPLDRIDLSLLPRPEPLPAAPAAGAVAARAAVLSAAQLSGFADGALELTRRYVQQREQFGAPLAKLPAVARGLAEMRARVTEATAGVEAGLAGLGDPGGGLEAAAVAFIAAATAATAVARAAHQLHGAIGVTAEYSLHRWTTRLWSGRDWPRPQVEWADQLGRVRAEEEVWRVTAFDRT
jgi:alkylation response protein AidB-like acyl-CoA dehydrogenase